MLSPQYRGMVPIIGKSINAKPATSPLANYGRFGTHGGRHGGRPGPVPDPWPTLLSDNDYSRPLLCMSRTVGSPKCMQGHHGSATQIHPGRGVSA
ncbi:hypothetical protein CDEST_00075 [Colletotrichum destructivum]|uniref:Uncharacterized protein n=1 Tax=Colletotrichum destructivum TaxID=34406 RepID=A0AAX4HW15_9PEZI|nr:hypothetical protein CDEST_00075 [Colletotrichum destructivum]